MNQEAYQELLDLIEIFHNCTNVEGIEIWCFKFIKKIVDGEVLEEKISEEIRLLAKEQFDESMEWLHSMRVKVDYLEELRAFID
ncbi:MAG: hypothetical protein IJA10_03765 [Lachnospiraceae bacterium]|nr:hypothetical protein [Lachnospiraceae bacterium]